MLLYYTDKMRGLQLADPKHGVGEWVEFTDKPLAGYGDATYTVDIPEGKAKQWEFTGGEPNLIKGVRYFDIPARELTKFQIRMDSYRRLTGRAWNQWLILLQSRVPDMAGTTAVVWASREGIASAEPFEKNGDQLVQITLTDMFEVTEDYLIMETRQFEGRQWNLELLVGITPRWADFPAQWAEWVQDATVQKSAIDYLRGQFPTVATVIELAETETEKINKIHAWRLVGSKIEQLLGRNIGRINAGSWTSTLAMPIRIAEKVGGWVPPKMRPEYIDPEASGRVCIASPKVPVEQEPEVQGTGVIIRRFEHRHRNQGEVAV